MCGGIYGFSKSSCYHPHHTSKIMTKSRLKQLGKLWKQFKVVGFEVVTSIAHLIAAVPKLLAIVFDAYSLIDTTEEKGELLRELTEKFLEKFRNKSKEYKAEL